VESKQTALLALGFERRSDVRVSRREGSDREPGSRKIPVREFICDQVPTERQRGRHPTLSASVFLNKMESKQTALLALGFERRSDVRVSRREGSDREPG